MAIESSDIVFATDSIPAVFGVTTNVFVVFTSNAFAVLGLRALYFVFADIVDRFAYLKYGLAVLLVFVGVKLLLAGVVELPIAVTLGVIAVAIGVSVLVSVIAARGPSPEN
jgi:tellurite resistance protein TerC